MMRTVLSACLAFVIAVLATATSARAEEALDAAVKATYLYKLAPFVDWPPASFPAPDSPFDLCIVGDDPFSAAKWPSWQVHGPSRLRTPCTNSREYRC